MMHVGGYHEYHGGTRITVLNTHYTGVQMLIALVVL